VVHRLANAAFDIESRLAQKSFGVTKAQTFDNSSASKEILWKRAESVLTLWETEHEKIVTEYFTKYSDVSLKEAEQAIKELTNYLNKTNKNKEELGDVANRLLSDIEKRQAQAKVDLKGVDVTPKNKNPD
jgi:hypothetical protein